MVLFTELPLDVLVRHIGPRLATNDLACFGSCDRLCYSVQQTYTATNLSLYYLTDNMWHEGAEDTMYYIAGFSFAEFDAVRVRVSARGLRSAAIWVLGRA